MPDQNFQPKPDLYNRVVTQCTCANLRKTARVITELYDEFLKPSGLLGTQFRLLGAIAASGSIALTPLAELMDIDRTTLARNLKPLERDGLVEMSAGEDRRIHRLTLTDSGRAALMAAFPLWEEAQAWVIRHLGEDRWRAMLGDWSNLVELARQK
jgi:DNA-binding MarR family transcriptional regulator